MSSCAALEDVTTSLIFILLLAAIVILVVLAFSIRRKTAFPLCCGGRPGVYSIVDLLHRGPHRLIYAAIFGVMADEFLELAVLGSGVFCEFTDSPYQAAVCNVVISKVLAALLVGLLYGPLFVCVNTPRPLLGHITGLIYLILLIVTSESLYSLYYSGCAAPQSNGQIAIGVLSSLPSYVFYLILIIWFICKIVNDIVIMKRGSAILFTQKKNAYLFKYTTHLLRKRNQVPVREGRWQKIKSFFWIFENDFKFPLRFLAPLIVMVSLNFKLFFFGIRIGFLILEVTVYLFPIPVWSRSGIVAIATLAGLVATGICGIMLFQFAVTVHKHLKLAAQGKFKFYSKTLRPHPNILASALKYGGYQIGYFIWAWLIFWILAVVPFTLIAALIVGLVYFPQIVGPKLFEYVLTVAWIPVVLFFYTFVCKYFFLETDTGGKFLAITNRNAFNIFSYFVFLYNGLVGFVAAIVRVLISLMFGTLLLFRLDHNIMMDGFKFADLGNKIYLGFLYLEHTYNNPVANTFVALLVEGKHGERKEPLQTVLLPSSSPAIQKPQRNKRLHNRWLVAYTLINNPSLRPLRASQLPQGGRGQEEGGEREENEYEPMVLVHETK